MAIDDLIEQKFMIQMSVREQWQKIILKKWGVHPAHGSIKIKAVRCGKKNCHACPHAYYAYLIYYLLGKRVDKYLGKCDRYGRPKIDDEKKQKSMCV